MEYRKLGSLKVSVVGIGCNNFGWRTDAAGTAAVVDAALDAGINFFDTADVYGGGQSEEFLGKALQGRREKAIIATKFGMKMGDGKEGARPEYIRQALEASLRRLRTDMIDLYQIHRPDPTTPIAETMQALNDAVKAGKIREIGCSNFSAEQMRAARATPGTTHFSSVQNDYSLMKRDAETDVLPECTRTGVRFLPYFPLANGLLTGKYRKGKPFPESSRGKDEFGPKVFTPQNLKRVEALVAFAESRGHSLLELAFSWFAARPEISSIIAGAKTADQARANSRATSWKTDERGSRGSRSNFGVNAGSKSEGRPGMNPIQGSRYIHWAKTRHHVTFDLATSGVNPYPDGEPPFDVPHIEIQGRSGYGYPALVQALASKFGVVPESVVHAMGTSMSNHLAMAALIGPGDEVLIERPAYEPLLAVAGYLRASVKRFDRRPEENFAVDIHAIERSISSRTRLIVLTNLHNPSSAFIDEETLRSLRDIARSAGARVLVDEVYLEAMFDRAPRSAFHLGNEFVTTGSLTKAYGLSGLRCGWVLAEPEFAERLRRLQDLFDVVPPHAIEQLSVVALENLGRIAARAKTLIEANRKILHAFLDSRTDLRASRPACGTVMFPEWLGTSASALCNLLLEKYDTAVVPGDFFEMPAHFRIGMGCDREVFAEGLNRLAAALDELSGS